mgnify:FL=1
MKPRDVVETGQSDMFRSRLDQIIDMGHEKVVLAQQIDWQFLWEKCGGEPPRNCRRLFCLSYAAMAGSSSMA